MIPPLNPPAPAGLPYTCFVLLKALAGRQQTCKVDPLEAATWLATVARGLIQADGTVIGAAVDHQRYGEHVVPCVLHWPAQHSEQAQVLCWCVYDPVEQFVQLLWNF